jgi:hypothetical protein
LTVTGTYRQERPSASVRRIACAWCLELAAVLQGLESEAGTVKMRVLGTTIAEQFREFMD